MAQPITRHAYPQTLSDAAFRQLVDGDPSDKDPTHKPQDGVFTGPIQVGEMAWVISSADYMARSDIWRLDPNGNLIPWFIIENKLGVENVREIGRQLKARNIGAVLWAGTGDLSASYTGDQAAVARAVDTILAAGKEFGLPVAMNGTANLKQRIAQGARIFMGGVTPQLRKEAGR